MGFFYAKEEEEENLHMGRHIHLFGLFLIISMIVVVGCQNGANHAGDWNTPVKPNSIEYPVTVVDQSNQRVTIEKEPQRIVSLVPSGTEIAHALGLLDKIVAVTTNDDYPEAVKSLPKVGDMNINIEEVVKQKPDLVLASTMNGEETIKKLRDLGFPVIVLHAENVKEIIQSIQILSQVTNKTYEAEQLVANMQQKLREVTFVLRQLPEEQRKTVWWDDSSFYSPGAGTLQNELIELAGGKNVVASQNGWVQVTPEQVIKWNPSAILIAYGEESEIAKRPGWSQIQAVKERRYIKIDPNLISRPGPRVIDGVEQLTKQLYPELYQ